MKINLIRYTQQFTGEIWFKVTAGGSYISGSSFPESKEKEAREFYEKCIKYAKPDSATEEVIKSVDIE